MAQHGRWRMAAGVALAGVALPVAAAAPDAAPRIAWANRLTWGATPTALAQPVDPGRWLDAQLAGADAALPAPAADAVAQMRISREPLAQLVVEEEAQNRDANALTDPDQKKAARGASEG